MEYLLTSYVFLAGNDEYQGFPRLSRFSEHKRKNFWGKNSGINNIKMGERKIKLLKIKIDLT